jgi:hypothetical protein
MLVEAGVVRGESTRPPSGVLPPDQASARVQVAVVPTAREMMIPAWHLVTKLEPIVGVPKAPARSGVARTTTKQLRRFERDLIE